MKKVISSENGGMIDYSSFVHNLSSFELKPEKNSGLNGIRTHNLCDTDAVLYQQSYQANWELATLLEWKCSCSL